MQPACILWAKCCSVSSHSFVSGCCWASPTCRHDDRLRPSWNILDSWSRSVPWCSVSTRGCFLNVYPSPLQMLWPCGDCPVLYHLLHTASLPTTSIKSVTKVLLGHTAQEARLLLCTRPAGIYSLFLSLAPGSMPTAQPGWPG